MSLRLPQAALPLSAAEKHANQKVPVLSVSPIQEDHEALERLSSGENWRIHKVFNVAAAMEMLGHSDIPVVVCHSDSVRDSWKMLLERSTELSRPPSVILASRLADEYLWVEALNLGAYDVLAKPLVPIEVSRAVRSAWLRWRNEHVPAVNLPKRMAVGVSA